VADVVAGAILTLPMAPNQFALLVLGNAALLIFDVLSLMEGK
jgi:hypothetical protein